MAKDPGFIFYPGDYLRDTQTLSEKSQVAYDRIMCEHMRNICISHMQLKFFTKRLDQNEIDELMFVLTETKEGYQIEWVAESIIKRKAYSESRRQNRSHKTTKHMNNISKTYVKHMENENENENDNINGLKGGPGEKINFADLENEQWFIGVLSFLNNKIDFIKLKEYWQQYQKAMIADDDLYRDAKSYRSHFRNWVKIQTEKKNGTESGLMKRKNVFAQI
ncbi:MAG: hypothetical protein OEY01_11240 [Desulfobulbaceae bacterium]|nr:hypothetical protein [Desulfobulbaceae bacterium]